MTDNPKMISRQSNNVDNIKFYENLDNQFRVYLSKISSNSIINKLTAPILKRNLYVIVKDAHSGYASISNSIKLRIITISADEFNINMKTGNTPNIDKILFDIARSVIVFAINSKPLNSNRKIELSEIITNFIAFEMVINNSKINLTSDMIRHLNILVLVKIFRMSLKLAIRAFINDNVKEKEEYKLISNTYKSDLSFTELVKVSLGIRLAIVLPNVNFTENSTGVAGSVAMRHTNIIAKLILTSDGDKLTNNKSKLNSHRDLMLYDNYKRHVLLILKDVNKIKYQS